LAGNLDHGPISVQSRNSGAGRAAREPWYLAALLILPLTHVAGVVLAAFRGGSIPFYPQRLVLLPIFLLTNLGEEIGWRGYALPRLQARHNSLTASLILGLGWAAFHWVAMLQNPAQPWAFLSIGSAYLVAMAIFITWVFNHTRGSVAATTGIHAMYDVVSISVMPLAETRVPLLGFGLGAGLACLAALGLVLARRTCLGRPEGSPSGRRVL
jgi:membrane protease YdiL (CAAX protease family)